jgi:uncharacterized protein (DUF934 family)
MALLKRDRIVDDPWIRIDDDAQAPVDEAIIVSLARWQRDREVLAARNGAVGIVLASDQPPELIADDIAQFGVICLEFPKFTDGRAYSYARLLRSRYDFAGELRAVGNVLRDQALFMRRCGIDAFEIPDGADTEGWRVAFDELTVRYQPAEDTIQAEIAVSGRLPYINGGIAARGTY